MSADRVYRPIMIDGWPIDIARSESYSFESDSTSFPVEEGSEVSDHIRVLPLVITLDCVVSDSPLGGAAHERLHAFAGRPPPLEGGNKNDFSVDTFARLMEIRDARRAVTVECSRGTFENMVLSFTVPVDIGTSGGLHFTATLKQIQLIENKRVTVQTAKAEHKAPVDRGHQAAKQEAPFIPGIFTVFTIRPGEKNPTWLGGGDPGPILGNTAAGNHYLARQGDISDGSLVIDANGHSYRRFAAPRPMSIDVVPVDTNGVPIQEDPGYISPLEQRMTPKKSPNDPSDMWRKIWE